MSIVEDKAKELFEQVNRQIQEAREELAQKMLEQDMGPDLWGIADNMAVVIKDPSVPYQCWPILLTKPRMNRGNT